MNRQAAKGDWVLIHEVVLQPGDRSPDLPEDTRTVPLEMRVKGFLQEERAEVGDHVHIKTLIGRIMSGRLEAINPEYGHSFARAVPELLTVGNELKDLLAEEDA